MMRELLIPSLFTAAAAVAPLIACAVGSDLPGSATLFTEATMSSSVDTSAGTGSSGHESSESAGETSTPAPAPDDLAALVGAVDATDLRWRNDARLDCNALARVICAQIYGSVDSGTGTDSKSQDRYIFVTAPVPGFELGGYGGAQELCNLSAVAADLPGQYAPVLGSPDIVPALWPELGYGVDGGAVELPGEGVYVLPPQGQGQGVDPDAIRGPTVGRSLAGELQHGIDRTAAGRTVEPDEVRAVWTALGDGLWLDLDDLDLEKYTPDEQRYLALSRTCLDWGAW